MPMKSASTKKLCRYNLRLFMEQYLPSSFHSEWNVVRIEMIRDIEHSALYGDTLRVISLPPVRSIGKTAITLAGALWCSLYRHRKSILVKSTARMEFECLKKFVLKSGDFSDTACAQVDFSNDIGSVRGHEFILIDELHPSRQRSAAEQVAILQFLKSAAFAGVVLCTEDQAANMIGA